MTSRWDELSTNELFQELRRTANPELRDYLICLHEGLVRHVAKDYANGTDSYEDILGVGHVGLINAVDRFDPDRGTKFATFAVPTIRGEIQRYFRDAQVCISAGGTSQIMQIIMARKALSTFGS